MRILLKLFLIFLLIPVCYLKAQDHPLLYDLRCEHLSHPIGLDRTNPRLSWKLSDTRHGATQRAFRVKVFHHTAQGDDEVWNTGIVNSDAQLINYEGDELISFAEYIWTLEAWDKDNQLIEAQSATFETGMMSPSDWEGHWITDHHSPDHRPASMFRKGFQLNKPIKSATLYIAAAGLHDFYINGKRVTDEFLNPAFTRFDKRLLYNSYDVTHALQEGDNAMGLILGNGWYNHQVVTVLTLNQAIWRGRPAFLANLKITFTDDTEITISSGDDWKYEESPVVFNSIYAAESYDFRKEIPEWNRADFSDDGWQNALITSSPTQKLEAQVMPPITRTDTLRPIEMKRLNQGRYLFKFPRNMAGIVELKGTGFRDTKIQIRHSEVITPFDEADNSHFSHVYPDPLEGEAFHEDVVYLAGGPFSFSPRFSYKGFQYVEVIADRALELTEESLVAYPVNSNMETMGRFNSSNETVNKIWQASNNSYLSNMMGYPTDCPQREKNGWTGDAHLMAESGLYNYEAILIYEKWLRDHLDAQANDGSLPMVIPASHWGYHFPALDWTSSMIIIPWKVYEMTGDPRILEDNYEAMKRFLRYFERGTINYLMNFDGFADWQTVSTPSSPRLIASAFYYRCTDLLSKIAIQLGHVRDHQHYSTIASKTKAEFNRQLYNPDRGVFGDGTQTELALSIAFGLVAEQNKAAVAGALSRKMKANGGFLDVGVIGASVLLTALVEAGHAELAFDLATETEYPSWGFWMEQGLTTLPEGWNYRGWGFGASLNHAFFGPINAWLYKTAGGIHPDESAAGFKSILLKPQFDHRLGEVEVWHDAPPGKIEAKVAPLNASTFQYQVTVPPGSTARLYSPDGFTLTDFDDSTLPLQYVPRRNQNGLIEFESGTYIFTFSSESVHAYPFPDEIIDPDTDYGNLEINDGFVYFNQGNLRGTSVQLTMIDQAGRVIDERIIDFLIERTPLINLSQQKNDQPFSLETIVTYEDASSKRLIKRILKSEY